MKYLVTGGCGFIGSHLCHALKARGDEVVVLDDLSSGLGARLPEDCRFIIGDVRDPDAVAEAMHGVHGVFHLAAVASVQKCSEQWREGHLTNQAGAVTVFEAARELGKVPVVYASSAAVYGDAGHSPLMEHRRAAPQTPYGADKYGCELHARVAQLMYGVRTVGLRPFNVYGPGQDPSSPYSGVISIFADRIQKQEPFHVFGDGKQTRDFVFVEDAVRFFLAAMGLHNRRPAIFNISTGRATSLLELIALLEDILDERAQFVHVAAKAGDIRHSRGMPLEAMQRMGAVAKTSLKLGLIKTYNPDRLRQLLVLRASNKTSPRHRVEPEPRL
ncbi:NAD-dependent epimerase/dehydratase family protein [Sulfitobacter maritimus]|uniref:NAD-dependent epimerase/dehydratase family protein n=1 Tax=Sulfitobacter maritimus TaxID=2741719 RepID=UPI001C2E8FA3|nr:NAD-dependent epimerase/dehydratase family protein [Sulfitobacter maritimus]